MKFYSFSLNILLLLYQILMQQGKKLIVFTVYFLKLIQCSLMNLIFHLVFNFAFIYIKLYHISTLPYIYYVLVLWKIKVKPKIPLFLCRNQIIYQIQLLQQLHFNRTLQTTLIKLFALSSKTSSRILSSWRAFAECARAWTRRKHVYTVRYTYPSRG